MKPSLRFRMLVGLIPIFALLVSPATAGAARAHTRDPFQGVSNGSSDNWSGYAAHGAANSFTSVSASWVQPAGTCTGETAYSAFWVGLDGYTSKTVEQMGSEVDCSGSSPVYYAWYEMFPANSVKLRNPVSPGDHFTASVISSGNNFTLTIADTTQSWNQTITKSRSAKRSSAEVIVEAPCCTAAGDVLPLTDFGKVNFTSANVNGAAIGSSSPTKINIRPIHGGTDTDNTSKLSGAEDFSVTWEGN